MTQTKTKKALLMSVLSMVLCVAMLVGMTFAWFTDTASTGVNKIVSGKLDVDLQMKDANGKWVTAVGKTLDFVKATGAESEAVLWEPGCRYKLPDLRVVNNGNLALKYKIVISGAKDATNEAGKNGLDLLNVIDWTYNVSGNGGNAVASLDTERHLAAKTGAEGPFDTLTIEGAMQTTAGNEYQGLAIDGIAITVYATQDTVESDSYGKTYDKNATYYPVIDLAGLKDALLVGGEVAVNDDVTVVGTDDIASRTIISKPTTLTLNKKILSPDGMGENQNNFVALIVDADTTINAGKDGGIDTGENGAYAINVRKGATLTINGGTYYGGGTAVQVQEGTLVINGGFFAVEPFDAPYGYNFLLNCYDPSYKAGTAHIIVNGGTFVNFDPSNNAAEGAGTNFVAEGYSVISETKANGETWYTVVKGDGKTAETQDDLNSAINNANTATTVKLTEAGKYTLPSLSGKDITVVGTKDTVIDMKDKINNNAKNIAFEGVTVNFGTENYKGFQHTGKLTYKDCTITGKQFLYGDEVEFVNCDFVQSDADYNVWTYGAGKVLFKDCNFNCKGKAVLIYNEGALASQNVDFQNCKFNASAKAAGKAAIEIDCRFTSYNVIIDQATANNVKGFDNGSKSNSTVWNVKAGNKPTTVTVAGTVVYDK